MKITSCAEVYNVHLAPHNPYGPVALAVAMHAGLLARRYGERLIWGGALLGKVAVPLVLAIVPHPNVIKALALWQGFTGALMWIAGVLGLVGSVGLLLLDRFVPIRQKDQSPR